MNQSTGKARHVFLAAIVAVQACLEVEELLHEHEHDHEFRAGCWLCALLRYVIGTADLVWSALGDLRDFADRPQRQQNLLAQL
jgi:hypothetical protein